MIKYKKVETYNLVPEEKICNRCKKSFKENLDDMIGWHEFFHAEFEGGFGSVFGDGAKVEINLCQVCVYEMLGPYLEIGPNWFEQSMEQEAKNFRRENG